MRTCLTCIRQGRHRYYRVASPLVARMLESISLVAAIEAPPRHRPRSPHDDALRLARTCYDHLAGRLGVAIADALVARRAVALGDDGGEVTAEGAAFSARAWASTSPEFRGGAPSAGPASTGASGGRISPARSAPRSPKPASRAAGSSGSATAGRSRSRRAAASRCVSCCTSTPRFFASPLDQRQSRLVKRSARIILNVSGRARRGRRMLPGRRVAAALVTDGRHRFAPRVARDPSNQRFGSD